MLKAILRSIHAPIYRRRLECLIEHILPQLKPGDKVLDVGCGGGGLGASLLSHKGIPKNLCVEGLETHPRGGEAIKVHGYSGGQFPFADNSFDIILLMDVLHHDRKIINVLREAARVAKRLVIVKDHKPDGLFAQPRICLLDWAANAGYNVKCLYYYPTHQEWKKLMEDAGLRIEKEILTLRPYPGLWNLPFGGRLHYIAFASPAK